MKYSQRPVKSLRRGLGKSAIYESFSISLNVEAESLYIATWIWTPERETAVQCFWRVGSRSFSGGHEGRHCPNDVSRLKSVERKAPDLDYTEMESKDLIKQAIYGSLVLFLLSGLSLIVFGVTIRTPFGQYLTMKEDAFPVNYGMRIGFLFVLFTFTGLSFYATAKENNRLSTVMAVLLVILAITELILGVVYFNMQNEADSEEKKSSSGMKMLNEYGLDAKITKAFDEVQRNFACCGISDYRDWFTSRWAAAQGKNDRVPTSCCKIPSASCGYDMTIKNPVDVINLIGCTGLNYSYSDREKVVGGVGLAIALAHLLTALACVVFLCCLSTARGLSPIDALKGKEPSDEGSKSGPGFPRRSPARKALQASQEDLGPTDDLPSDASKDLRDKSK